MAMNIFLHIFYILIRLNSKCKVRKEDMVYKPNVNVYLLIENKQLKGSRMKYQ